MNNDIKLDFCRTFNYPPQLTNLLKEIFTIVARQPIRSVLLVGSTARGEVSMQVSSDLFELWSDIEFIIVPQNGQTINQQELKKKFKLLQDNLGMRNPFFHIDFAVMRSNRFSRLPKRIGIYEAKQNGVTVLGEDVRGYFPEITLNNLDYANTKYLILNRLTEMLLYIPQQVVNRTSSPYEQKIFNYIQARNALDILTIFLPNQSILLPSYSARDKYLQNNWGELEARFCMDSTLPDFLSEALKSKLTLNFDSPPIQSYKNVLQGYSDLLTIFLELGTSKTIADVCNALDQHDLDLDDQQFFTRQRAWEWKLFLRRFVEGKPVARAIFYKKRFISILLLLHQSLLLHLQDNVDDAQRLLGEARRYFQLIDLQPLPEPSSLFVGEWLNLRRAYFDIFTNFFLNKRSQRTYYQSVLEWKYNE